MSKMTGLRNGQIPGVPTIIPAGSSIRGAMASTVSQLGGFNNFIIRDNPQDVPYDIQIETGGYVYDIISKLRDISSNWETFFDVNGVFHYQPINAYYSDEIIADSDLFKYVVTSVTQKTDFENVKNVIEVFGKSLDPKRYGDVATLSDDTYSILLSDLTTLTPSLTIGFTTPSNQGTVENAKLKINDFDPLPLVDEEGNSVTIDESDTYFVVMNKSQVIQEPIPEGVDADYTASVTVNGNIYNLSIPTLSSWQTDITIDIPVPSMSIILNEGNEYTIVGEDVEIPEAGQICYVKILSSSTAQFISATTPTYDIDNISASGLTYNIKISDLTKFSRNDIIRFEAPYIEQSPNIQINNYPACQISDVLLISDHYNLIKLSNHTYRIWVPTNSGLLFLGHQQIYATVSDTNPESPFYIEKDLGKINLVLKDGEYNNIYTDQLALERARYELYLHCRMEDSIDLTMVPVYWLDVNRKIYINQAGINSAYIIKSIQIDLSPTGTMQLNAIKFYPDMLT